MQVVIPEIPYREVGETLKISNDLYKMLINQIAHELQNAYVYSNIQSKLKFMGLEGLAKWFGHQHDEEDSHAQLIFDYLNDRNELVEMPIVTPISVVKLTVNELVSLYLKREQDTTTKIESLIKQAELDGDRLSYTFLLDFVAKQRQEEDEAQTMYDRICESGLSENMPLLILYDNGLE